MTSDSTELRKQVGIVLRLPVVLLLGAAWVVFIWWWLAGLMVVLAGGALILKPLGYPIRYAFRWLVLAYKNSTDEVLPNYWDRYPDEYVEGIGEALTLGFPNLHRWLVDGFDASAE